MLHEITPPTAGPNSEVDSIHSVGSSRNSSIVSLIEVDVANENDKKEKEACSIENQWTTCKKGRPPKSANNTLRATGQQQQQSDRQQANKINQESTEILVQLQTTNKNLRNVCDI